MRVSADSTPVRPIAVTTMRSGRADASLAANECSRTEPGTMLVVHVSVNRERTTHSRTGVVPTGSISTVVRPESVSTRASARGAFGARLSSHGDAGTNAGTAYGPATRRSPR